MRGQVDTWAGERSSGSRMHRMAKFFKKGKRDDKKIGR